jgi:hypothetical protein
MPHPTVEALATALGAVAEARRARDEAIRARLAEGLSLREVAKEFGGSAQWVKEVRDRG